MARKPLVLIAGSGAREDALVSLFARSGAEVISVPGNAGTARLSRNIEGDPVEIAATRRVDLVVVGPEDLLAAGIGDRLRERSIRCIAPTAAASRLESSKIFGKQVAMSASIPVAAPPVSEDAFPYYAKFDGLAAGKGAFLCRSREDLAAARLFAAARKGVLVFEERLTGDEFSSFVLVDGAGFRILGHAMDYKRLRNDEASPMTGGMGASFPHPSLPGEMLDSIALEWSRRTVSALRQVGIDYEGILFLGGIMTERGPFLLEYNCRWGDPEAQAVLFGAVLADPLDLGSLERRATPTRTVVVATCEYPIRREPISIGYSNLRELELRCDLHYGASRHEGEAVAFSGGRILSVTADADADGAWSYFQAWIADEPRLVIRGDLLSDRGAFSV